MYDQSFPQQPQQQPHQQQGQQKQNPYQQQPVPHQQAPAPQVAAPRIPQNANDMRRIGAVTLDGLLALVAFFVGFRASSASDLPFPKDLLVILGSGFGFSFLNHVVLARIAGASIGKFATRTRVIYEKTGARPRVTRLFRRWVGGYLFIVIWMVAAAMDAADGDGPDDFCGVRLVRYRDLRAFAAMHGR